MSGSEITITNYTGPGGGVTIPSSIPGVSGTVTSIGDFAFWALDGLTSVTVPDSVTSIGNGAFGACSFLTNAAIGGGVTSIGVQAFGACSGLTRLTIPTSLRFIGAEVFSGCSGLTNVTIPSSVTSLGDAAFLNCTSLTGAYFQGNAPAISGYIVFESTAPQFSIYFPSTASGWSTPTWYGYPAQPSNYTPPAQPSVLSLRRGLGTLTPAFGNLQLGTNYQLQVSTDLSTWSNTGAVFTATNTSEVYPQPFGVATGNRLFFRLRSAP